MADEIQKKVTKITTTDRETTSQISPASLDPKIKKPTSTEPAEPIVKPGQTAASGQAGASKQKNIAGGTGGGTGAGGGVGKTAQPIAPKTDGTAGSENDNTDVAKRENASPDVQYPDKTEQPVEESESPDGSELSEEEKAKRAEEEAKNNPDESELSEEEKAKRAEEAQKQNPDESQLSEEEKAKRAEAQKNTAADPNKIQPTDKNAERIAKIKNEQGSGNGLIDRAKRAHGNISDLRDKYSAEGLKDRAKEEAEKVAKQAVKKAAQKAGLEAAKKAALVALQAALDAVVAFFGWPVLIVCGIITILMLLIFAGMAYSATNGYFGKTYPTAAGAGSPIVTTLGTKTSTEAKAPGGMFPITGKKLLDYFDAADKKYVEEGTIDVRLAEAIDYLTGLHSRLGISHIISGYQDMPTDPESGKDRDPQLISNVSAHKDGLAADIAEIDFFYKVQNYNPSGLCSFTFFSDGSNDADLSKLSDGTTITPDTMGPIIDQIAAEATYNLKASADLIKYLQETVGANRSKIENSLTDEKGIYTDTQNDLSRSSGAVSNMQAKLPGAYAKIKSLNQQAIDTRAKISGNTSTEATDLTKQLDQTQIVLNEAIQDYNRFNEAILEVNRALGVNSDSLESLVATATPEKDTTKNLLNSTRTNANSLSTLSGFTYVNNIDDLLGSLDTIGSRLNELSDMIKNGDLDKWTEKLDELKGKIGDADSILGGMLGDKDKLFERGCSPDEQGKVITSNTMFRSGIDASGTVHVTQAIPIKVAWQDEKPLDAKIGDVGDLNMPPDPYLGFIDFTMVYRPESRRKTHQVITELLKFPYDKTDIDRYKVTQLITFSRERDVTPFATILDALYGKKRPANYGLFNMPEAWAQVHVGY